MTRRSKGRNRFVSELSRELPHPWSEPTGYCQTIARVAGVIASSTHP